MTNTQAGYLLLCVFRRHFALFLLLSWIVPSGLDLAEDVYFPGQTEIHNEVALPAVSGLQSRFIHNWESADSLARRRSLHLEEPRFEISLHTIASSLKPSKLYKLHGALLI